MATARVVEPLGAHTLVTDRGRRRTVPRRARQRPRRSHRATSCGLRQSRTGCAGSTPRPRWRSIDVRDAHRARGRPARCSPLDARRGDRRVLRENDRGSYTVPTKGLYPFQWNWDSCFTALGLSHFDPGRAWTEIETLFAHQWDDGMVPHMVFHEAAPGYFPGPEVWSTGRTPADLGDHPAADRRLCGAPALATHRRRRGGPARRGPGRGARPLARLVPPHPRPRRHRAGRDHSSVGIARQQCRLGRGAGPRADGRRGGLQPQRHQARRSGDPADQGASTTATFGWCRSSGASAGTGR